MAKTQELANPALKEPKDLRYRRAYFPQAEDLVFNTARRGFVPLPILLRKLMRHLSAPELRVLMYLHLRISKFGICYPTQEEIAFELGLQGTKNLAPYLKSLETKHLISTKTAMGRKFYLVHDPRVALQHMLDSNELDQDELDEVNQLCLDLGQAPLERSSSPSNGEDSIFLSGGRRRIVLPEESDSKENNSPVIDLK